MVKVVPVAVTVTTLMAVTLFMDTASARLAGQVSILGVQTPGPLWSWGASLRKCVQKNPYGRGGAGQAHPIPLSHRYSMPPALP